MMSRNSNLIKNSSLKKIYFLNSSNRGINDLDNSFFLFKSNIGKTYSNGS